MINNTSGKREYILLTLTVCIVHFLLGLDINIVSVSLPTISQSFNITPASASKVVWIYFLVLTCFLPLSGKLGDQFGFKKLYLLGIFTFLAGAVLCGLSTSFEMLVAFRILQAAGGAILFSITPAIISSYLPEGMKGKAFGINYAFVALGGVVGRAFSGYLLDAYGWSSIFFINIIPGIAALVLALRYIPSVSPSNKKVFFDVLGSIYIFIGLFFLLFAINNGQQMGWMNQYITTSFIIAAVFIYLFIKREIDIPAPLFNLNYLKKKKFSFPLISFSVVYIVTNGMVFLFPFYLQWIKSLSKQETGLLMTIPSVMQIVSGFFGGYLSDKKSIRIICTYGIILTFLSYLFFYFLDSSSDILLIIASLSLFGIAIGTFIPANTNRIMSYAGIEEKGSISALMLTVVRTGSALGVCFFAAILSVYIPQANPITANVPMNIMESGFKAVFLFGTIVCLIGIYFAVRSEEKEVNQYEVL
ncbi:MAG: MFS transporter [Ignavibacteriae bacterium]|nr:MAG: MFS transporter [Ignavibacteriota bacterium]